MFLVPHTKDLPNWLEDLREAWVPSNVLEA
jgi:hypothetical protein